MAYSDFTFPRVNQVLQLGIETIDLVSHIPVAQIRPDFIEFMQEGATLALATGTEKAKSEFIIAPILFELRRRLGGRFGLFSGVEFSIDVTRGLNGVCDFIITKSPQQLIVQSPLLAVVEAKNDTLRAGYGQCIAEMYAAQLFNQTNGNEDTQNIYGVVTTGSAWKFMKLNGNLVSIDLHEYYVDMIPKIMGILQAIVLEKID